MAGDATTMAAAGVSSAISGLFARQFGRGPRRTRTYFCDENVFVVMEGGLLPAEEQILKAGDEDTVRGFRLRFEEAIADDAMQAVEQVTGRKVLGYHSQVLFEPVRSVEVFVLDEPFVAEAPAAAA